MASDQRVARGGPGCLGWSLIIGLALSGLWYFSAPGAEERRAERDAILKSAQREDVTAAEMQQAFAENEVAAKARFGGKSLLISGVVVAVRESNGDAMVITLESPDVPAVEISIDADDRDRVAILRPGAKIVAHCARLLDMVGVRVPMNCRLQ